MGSPCPIARHCRWNCDKRQPHRFLARGCSRGGIMRRRRPSAGSVNVAPTEGPPRSWRRDLGHTDCTERRARAVAVVSVQRRSRRSPGCHSSADSRQGLEESSIRSRLADSGRAESATGVLVRLTAAPQNHPQPARIRFPATREMCSTDARVGHHPLRRGLGDAKGTRGSIVAHIFPPPTRPLPRGGTGSAESASRM